MIVSLYVAMSIFGKTFLTKKFDSVCYLGDIYIYCSDRLLWIEFVDFFFFVWFSSAFKFAKIYNIFEYDLFHYPFYSNENLLLMFYKFFYAISNLPKFITILKKFISPFSMTWNQSCIFFFLLTIQYQYTLYFLIKYFPPV